MADVSMVSTLQQALSDAQTQKAALTDKEIESAKEFEAVFLSQFVDEMMKTVDVGAATGGQDTHMWRSFMSEALSKSLVDQGGLGMAANIQQMMSAYKK